MKKKLMIIVFCLIFIPGFSSKKMSESELKNIRGQAGIVFELGEITIEVKYGEISYTDTDGLGTINKAGVKLRYDDNYTVLKFKPIKDSKKFSNENLKKIFGEQVSHIGLTEPGTANSNAGINKQKDMTQPIQMNPNLIIPISNLTIETTDINSLLTKMNLYHLGIEEELSKKRLISRDLNVPGISVNLPSVETEIGGHTMDVIVFTNEQSQNNNKVLITIEKGTSQSAILGGKIEIRPNVDTNN